MWEHDVDDDRQFRLKPGRKAFGLGFHLVGLKDNAPRIFQEIDALPRKFPIAADALEKLDTEASLREWYSRHRSEDQRH